MSNLLEHMKNKDEVLKTIAEAYRILQMDGLFLILQPNIRYCYKRYWDFFDHHIPLSDRSLVEVLELIGFKIVKVYPKFLPYTTKSRLPQTTLFVKIYLKIPILWRIFGKQTLIIGKK